MATAEKSAAEQYTVGELMVAAAAREIRDGEVVFVGMRLPLIAFVVAKQTHAPNSVGLFENGVIRTKPAPDLIYTMGDPPNLLNATHCLDMLAVITTKAVLRFGEEGEAYLHSRHPGVGIDEIVASTGWTLRVADEGAETLPPTPGELKAIREYDREGFWTS